MFHRSRSTAGNTAFTLLEVILALAILAGSVAILGEIMRSAGRSAADAQAETLAQMLAGSIMDKVIVGVIDAVDQERVFLQADGTVSWVYSLTIGQTSVADLISVEVLVEQDLEPKFNPVKYRLVRWVALQEEAAEEENEENSSQEGNDAA